MTGGGGPESRDAELELLAGRYFDQTMRDGFCADGVPPEGVAHLRTSYIDGVLANPEAARQVREHYSPGPRSAGQHDGGWRHDPGCQNPGCEGSPPPPTDEDAQRIFRLLAVAVAGDAGAVTDLLQEIADERGHIGIFETCAGLATMFIKAGELDVVPAMGEMLAIAHMPGYELPEDPALWSDQDRYSMRASRFIAATANRDSATALALFNTVPDAAEATGWVNELICMTAGLCQARIKEKEQEKGG